MCLCSWRENEWDSVSIARLICKTSALKSYHVNVLWMTHHRMVRDGNAFSSLISFPRRYLTKFIVSLHCPAVTQIYRMICNGNSANSLMLSFHYRDVIMGAMVSQIAILTIIYSIVYSGADQRNIKPPHIWHLCGEFTGHRWIPHTKGQSRGKHSIWWRHHGQSWHMLG